MSYKYSKIKNKQYVRDELIEKQANICIFCGNKLDEESYFEGSPIDKSLFPKTFFDHPMHIHHNHDTDNVIGLIHATCNAISWQLLGL